MGGMDSDTDSKILKGEKERCYEVAVILTERNMSMGQLYFYLLLTRGFLQILSKRLSIL